MHFCSKVAIAPQSLVVRCFLALATRVWLPKTYMVQYDMVSNLGGMDMICTMFLSIVSPSLRAITMEALIHVAKGGNGARSFGNTRFLARD